MKTFNYTYIEDGNIQEKKIRSNSIVQAKAFLKKKKITISSIKEIKKKPSLFEKKITSEDIVSFTQLFAGSIESGLSIIEALNILEKQVTTVTFQNAILDIITNLENGNSLSDAFSKVNIFPHFYPMLLKAGEASGNLEEVLNYIGHYLEKIDTIKKHIIGVITYPIIVSSISFLLLLLILAFVAPKFKDIFNTSEQLPFLTFLLFFLSDLVLNYSKIITTIIIGFSISM